MSKSQSANMLRQLVRKELREVLRDGRFWVAGVAIAGLLCVALIFGLRQQASVAREYAVAQASAEQQFLSQDEKNPHEAAHYGTYVFKPVGLLSFIDPGVEPLVGSSIRLVAHARNAPGGARAAEASSLSRLGPLSVAAVLQLLLPLLLLVLGFSTWTAERERGTLRLLLSLGAKPGTLFVGKLLGLFVSVACLLLPALLGGGLVLSALSEGSTALDRLAALGGLYALGLASFLFLALGISALAKSSRSALVAVLALWVGMALVLPRVGQSVAELTAPVLDREAFDREVASTMAAGLPGQGGREARVTAITEALLEREGFAGAETLMDPSLLAGLELQAEAQYENEVLDQLHAKRAQQLERREQTLRWFSLAAPPLALQSSSAALAGTDHAHHRHFADAAEQHRRALIEMLNRAFAESGGADGWSYRAGRETWAKAPAFVYQPPTLSWSLASQRVQLLSLGLWFVGSLAFAAWASTRVRAV